ncbi:hypothetical protein PtA15_4A877 [Puccinia triticina]|uniref:Cytosolic endo-beta-N-acetylglucosaminidase TIM barrel domain-containing protein n=1 Tax=Puccinia triticina TaxID=208348 RepID=A0ABY7CH32_9BASI|nr:uncharacterized protein PtA15_4A877 [Puccinia triticina]WAQ84424.1 hypothetical protein PtA15_4A877 [Puccinia triticina]
MPISSSIQTTINDPRKNSYYFVSLDELVGYFQSQPGLITNLAHSTLEDEEKLDPKTQQHSQLVVTADFKGGYYEDPFTRTYSFEWLGSVDIFVYFSHHRVSIPPLQWITAAKTHHTRILGTLIFENDSFDDLQYLLAGPQLSASTQTDPATKYYTSLNNTPLSTYFADRLIDLAIHHQFHGWLINIEIDVLKALQSYSRARLCVFAIKIWLEYLRKQGQIRVGPQWEVSWYDSVSYYDGSLSWQSQLRPQHNLNFFSAASSIFLDYHWSAGHLMFTQRFIDQFFALHRSPDSKPQETLERLDQSFEHSMDLKVETHQLRRSVLFGVDVFGRGCPYGGGFSSWKAALDILNASFSVALFAPGWTWESDVLQQERASLEESGPEWWKLWWRDERYSWVGLLEDPAQNHDEGGKSSDQKLLSLEPPNAYVDSLRIARENKQDEPKKGAGFSELPQHKPLMELFPVRHKSRSASFYTNWSLGSGHGIWVAGQHHFDPSYGIGDWSDMAMSFPKHDLSIRGGSVWSISGGAIVPTGVARCELVEHVGWFGSGCVEIKEQANGQPSSGAVKCLWMNTTSVVCSSEMDCRLVWKPIDPTGASTAPLGVVFQASDPSSQTKTSDPTISGNYSDASARPHMVTLSPGQAVLETHNVQTHELENGWYESTCQLKTQTSSSAMIDRLGITTIAGTRFAHYVGEISLAQSDHASPKPHNAPDSPLRVIWRPDATQQPMQIASPASRRLINKRGKVEWKYPGPSGPASNNHDRQTLLAWLIYLSKDASSASRCVNRKQAGAQRLVGVVKGFQEFDLNAFNAPPIDSDQTNDGNKAEEWNIIIKGIGSHGSIVCSGFCSLG